MAVGEREHASVMASRGASDASAAALGERLSLAQLSLGDLVELSTRLRRLGDGTASLEEASQRVADYLADTLCDADGSPACALLRVFVTARAAELPSELRALVADANDEEPCLTLLATRGAQPEWNDRRRSAGHQVIALGGRGGADPLAGLPMVKGLFGQFGVATADLGDPGGRLAFTDFGVFHVERAPGSPLVPAQDFVVANEVQSVLGFGCALADGRVVAVLLFSRVPINRAVADMFTTLAVSLQLGLVPLSGGELFANEVLDVTAGRRGAPAALTNAAAQRALEQLVTVLGETVRTQSAQLSAEAAVVDELRLLGTDLAAELELERLVDKVVRAAVRTTGAHVGAFTYTVVGEDGQSHALSSVAGVEGAGVEAGALTASLLPAASESLSGALAPGRPVRCDDITTDPRYDAVASAGLAAGSLPVRSYLAVAIAGRRGEVLGALFLGHPDVGVFGPREEALLVGLSGHAAVGLDNARLFASHRDTAVELQRSLLPGELAPCPGLTFRAQYRPGAVSSGIAVGGDWYDAVQLDDGRTAFVIGDVMGRGVRAAAAMGQLRTAVRVLLISGHALPSVLMSLDRMVSGLPDEQIATCAIGVYDPATETVSLISAGHLPVLLQRPGSAPELVITDRGGPLGALGEAPVVEALPFPPGSVLVMFTDGLVERREESITDGLDRLVATAAVRDPRADLDGLVTAMLDDGQDDDTAILVISAEGGSVS